jgi:hypothetical protein
MKVSVLAGKEISMDKKEYDALYKETIAKIRIIAGWQVAKQYDDEANGSLSFLFEALTVVNWIPEALSNRIEEVVSLACEQAGV